MNNNYMQKYSKPKMDNLGTKNPLAHKEDFTIETRKFYAPNSYDVNGNKKIIELELEPITKIYTKPEYRKDMNALSLRSKEMLLWIMYTIDMGKDFLWINKERYMEETQVKSINTYKSALHELIKELYLCPTTVKDVYWINPKYFFKGDRKKKYPSNVVTKYDYVSELDEDEEIELSQL